MSALHPNNIQDLYNIPIYQRLFTWGKEQIETLLDDLLSEYCRTGKDYYLGVLTITNNVSLNRKDLVDGQQRFTVLVLIGIIFSIKYKQVKWKNFLGNPDNTHLRLFFSARKNDFEYISGLIKDSALLDKSLDVDESMEGYFNDTMRKALGIISSYIINILDHRKRLCPDLTNDEVNLVGNFSTYIYEHLTFFTVELPRDYTARMLNTHFERMNSTGRNLENHEILKVSLLKEVGDNQYNYFVQIWNKASRMIDLIHPFYDEKTRKEYLDIIKKIQQCNDLSDAFGIVVDDQEEQIDKNQKLTDNNSIMAAIEGKKELTTIKKNEDCSTSNYRPFLTFTDFLLQVLYIILKEKKQDEEIVIQHFFNPNKLIETCEKYIGKDKLIEPQDFIFAVGKYRVIFDYYILRIDGNGSYRLASAGDTEHDKLEQYEAMLYADSSRYTYYRWIPFILSYVSENSNELRNEELLEKLKDHDSTIEEHKIVEFSKFSFGKFNNYYFRRLEYYLWEFFIDNINQNNADLSNVLPKDRQIEAVAIKAIKDYKFHQYNSVEHFHPRSEREQKDHWGDNDKDSFGNLALISDIFNLTQSDNALALKFARVKDQIDKNNLESIKLALMYYSAQKEYTNWTIKLMEDHKKLMVKFLESTYMKQDSIHF